MSIPEFIDISSDEETEAIDVKDVKPILLSSTAQEKTCHGTANGQPKLSDSFTRNELVENGTRRLTNADGFHHESGELGYSVPLCRRFWKSGDYEVGQANGLPGQTGKNRLRIHPKFLHSNATSHKWAFGAIAELLDNAVDEVQNGATFVIVDKFVNMQNKDPALLIQDDGGGMDPESLRRCMSFGFSDKQSDSSIGQYGNGFKTSTMRLGADVIVFSRCINKSGITQSVGLLSYTFLRQTSCGDIVVPVVDYEFDPHTAAFVRLIIHNENQFTSNLLTLLKWSPFSTEAELLKQFDDIKHHGTKIIVFNLWLTDDGDMEIDFESEPKDIMTNEPLKKIPRKSVDCDQTQKNVAHRLNFSLRAYSSVLYLHMPDNFKLILRGEVVEPHHIVKDLIYPECIKYRPAGNAEAEILTTIGYLEGAPHVNIHGFNIYHRNRLILPFWRVANNSYGKGRGVVGVLEANFIKPTHNKQDFEKSILFQKLETRLKEMTYEYWDFHCHLVGYTKSKHPSALVPAAAPSNQRAPSRASNGYISVFEAAQVSGGTPNFSSSSQGKPHGSQKGLPQKRKFPFHSPVEESLENQNVAPGNTESGTNHITLVEHDVQQRRRKEVAAMMQENVKLQEQCLEYEESEKKLLIQEETLRRELLEAQQVYENLLAELRSINEVKVEKLNV